MIPVLGVIRDEHLPDSVQQIRVSIRRKAFTTMQVSDSRRLDSPRHALAVFLKAAVYTADWTQFVRYFEMWMDVGATKFFIYYHSVTQQVLDVISFYSRHVDIELVQWSYFPVPEWNKDTLLDPNYFSYCIAQFTATNDALLRSKKDCVHLASMDLDDLPLIMPGNNLLEILANSTTDEVFFNWQLARTMTIRPAPSLSEYKFDKLRGFRYVIEKTNSSTNPYHILNKTILRTDKVGTVNVHFGLKNEDGDKTAGHLPLPNWQNTFAHTQRAFEECRKRAKKERPLECCTKVCERFLPSFSPSWVMAPQSWLNIDDSWQAWSRQ